LEHTQQSPGKARVLKVVRSFLLRQPIVLAVLTGGAVAFTILGLGLMLIYAHGHGWPWWFHGAVIALVTGLLAGLLTWLYVCEVKRHERQVLAGEQISHEVCNALQILVQRTYLYPERRTQLEDEAIERIRKVTREILPSILQIPMEARPVSPLANEQTQKCARTAKS
jgi:hypothetical protein